MVEKHGMSGTRIYRIWSGMKERCFNPNNEHFRIYGGRGIFVCEKWRSSFLAFYADMGDAPPGLTIDRIDNDKGYEPGNCRWATPLEQVRNSRTPKLSFDVAVRIIRRHIAGDRGIDLAAEFGVKRSTIDRVIYGKLWSDAWKVAEGPTKGMHGKHIRGEKNHFAKLRAGQIAEILSLAGNVRQSEIAKRFGVHPGTVWKIINGDTWRSLTPTAAPANEVKT